MEEMEEMEETEEMEEKEEVLKVPSPFLKRLSKIGIELG